jgi:hypothetical protein
VAAKFSVILLVTAPRALEKAARHDMSVALDAGAGAGGAVLVGLVLAPVLLVRMVLMLIAFPGATDLPPRSLCLSLFVSPFLPLPRSFLSHFCLTGPDSFRSWCWSWGC